MREEFRRTVFNLRFAIGRRAELRTENFAKLRKLSFSGRFVERDSDSVIGEFAQVDSFLGRAAQNLVRAFVAKIDAQSVKETIVSDLQT